MMVKYIFIMFCLFNSASAQKIIPGVVASSIQVSMPVADSFDYKFGWVNISTSGSESDAVKWVNIKIAVQAAIDGSEYGTGRAAVADDITVPFTESGYWVRFVVYPSDVSTFNKWSEIDNAFQQNIALSNGGYSGVFSRDTIAAGRLIATRYQTEFTNSIKFSR